MATPAFCCTVWHKHSHSIPSFIGFCLVLHLTTVNMALRSKEKSVLISCSPEGGIFLLFLLPEIAKGVTEAGGHLANTILTSQSSLQILGCVQQ